MTIEYTNNLGDEIASLLAEGYSMNQIGKMDGMPSRSTMLRWLRRDDIDFDARCARARRVQGELAVDEHKEIIDGTLAGTIPPDVARVVLSGLEWRAKKLEPKKYGDNSSLSVSGSLEVTSKEQRDAVVNAALSADS